MAPLFSIVIPVYNVAQYLRECLDSVRSQTSTDWEAICVDDGSTDGSSAILDEYRAKDTRFRVIHQPNAGVSAARNAALDHCSGMWIFFLDADDLLHPQGLEHISKIINAVPNVDIIRAAGVDFDECGKPLFAHSILDAPYSGIDISRHLQFPHVGVCPVAFRQDAVRGIRFKRYAYGEDLLFGAHALMVCNNMVITQGTLYGRRQRASSATHSLMTKDRAVDDMRSRLAKLILFVTYGKTVDNFFFRSEFFALSAGAIRMADEADVIDRPAIWRELFRINRRLGQANWLPPQIRYTALIIGASKSKFIARSISGAMRLAARGHRVINRNCCSLLAQP